MSRLEEIQVQIEIIKQQISKLPSGKVFQMRNGGRPQYYYQSGDDPKKKHIKKDAAARISARIELRQSLQNKLKELEAKLVAESPKQRQPDFYTSVVCGKESILKFLSTLPDFQHRECYAQLNDYLSNKDYEHVCVLFGLRRTGKTTMLKQVMANMTEEELSKTAYIKTSVKDNLALLNKDLKKLNEQGIKYLFIDEATQMKDFIDGAALFSDIYAPFGIKIVLSGTDSLGFWFAMNHELYDRAVSVHTTYIPFREFSRLLKINDIDQYIQYGGLLQIETQEGASFENDELTRKYILSAISENIQHSLENFKDGARFRSLYKLYEKDELTNAINRIIEDMNHRFIISVLTRDFISHDLGVSAANLRNVRDPEQHTEILDNINTANVVECLMRNLKIKNKKDQSVEIQDVHVSEIKEYLKVLDLIVEYPIEITNIQNAKSDHNYVLFTQPGMRYCQAQALVSSLNQEPTFMAYNEAEKKLACDKILEEIKGRMMEDIVLLETLHYFKNYKDKYRVFKLQTSIGEFDMVVYNKEKNCCDIFEIKHSNKIVPEQYRHLINEKECDETEKRFGTIRNKYVIYRGTNGETEGIQYLNVEEYLKGLTPENTPEQIFKETKALQEPKSDLEDTQLPMTCQRR